MSKTNKHKFDRMTSKVTTASMRTEYSGSLDEGVEMAFYSVGTKERRDALLEKLQTIAAKIDARDAESATEAA